MLKDAERKAERDSIAKIEGYKKHEKHVYRRIEAERKAAADENRVVNHDNVEAELEKQIRDLQSDLLEIEMKLQDALFISRKSFISKISSIIEEMKSLN